MLTIRYLLTAFMFFAFSASYAQETRLARNGVVSAAAVAQMGQMADLVNQYRATRRLPALAEDLMLSAAAQAHAEEMERLGYFSHTSANGWTVGRRVKAQGYCYRLVAENIATGWRTVPDTFQGWVQSAGHEHNLTDRRVRSYGLGVSGTTWVMVYAQGCR